MKKLYYFLLGMCLCCSACTRDFLDKKQNKALLVPTTLANFQALLDNYNSVMNYAPGLNVISSDDFYTTDNGLKGYTNIYERNSYLWSADIFEGAPGTDWTRPYQQVFYANVVLDGMTGMTPDSTSKADYNRVKGSALFYRAFALYELAQSFAAPYDKNTADGLPGIPVPLSSDVNVRPGRGTLRQTYDQVLGDLAQAKDLLPEQPAFKNRPSKNSALAMLARVYQTMSVYDQAEIYASACLKLNAKLIDYNTLTATASRPFPPALPNGNDEALFYTPVISYSFISSTATMVDSALYRSYAPNDLRKTVFFNDRGAGVINFKGTYSGSITGFVLALFAGLATDEVYLIRAECYAREGNTALAMQDLNSLLQNRWKRGTFVPYMAVSADDALAQVLTERRKEMVGRGSRWTDLRRLNTDPRFAITLKRVIGGVTYLLPPNDPRYVLPIPPDEIAGSGIAQNPR